MQNIIRIVGKSMHPNRNHKVFKSKVHMNKMATPCMLKKIGTLSVHNF